MNAKDAEFVKATKSLTSEPVVQPYMLEDETTKVTTLMAATGQKAIASRRLAVQRLGWSKDPDAEVEELEAQDSAGAVFDITEPTM